MDTGRDISFACDAMLGGLARWLRAAGYDASWHPHVPDWDVIRAAQEQGRVLLSSDTGIFRVGLVRDGDLPALFIPHGLSTEEQLRFVFQKYGLSLREPRCMACGGTLRQATREQVAGRVPPRTLSWLEQFYECTRCEKVFWQGTHWKKIVSVLQQIPASSDSSSTGPSSR